MENTPEFQKALEEAANKVHREYLFGGIGAVAKTKGDVEKALKDIQDHRKQLEEEIGVDEIQRKVKSIKSKARSLRRQSKKISKIEPPPRYSAYPDWASMTPEEIKKAEKKITLESHMQTHPYYQEVNENLKRRHGSESGLICPVCGEGDHGNRISGKPYCYMNSKHKAKGVDGPVPLLTPEKSENWEPPKKSKPHSLTFNEPDGVMKWRKSRD